LIRPCDSKFNPQQNARDHLPEKAAQGPPHRSPAWCIPRSASWPDRDVNSAGNRRAGSGSRWARRTSGRRRQPCPLQSCRSLHPSLSACSHSYNLMQHPAAARYAQLNQAVAAEAVNRDRLRVLFQQTRQSLQRLCSIGQARPVDHHRT